MIPPAKDDIMGDGHTLLSTCFGPLDVLSIIEGGKTYDHLIEHTVNIPFRGYTIKVLDLETMIRLKKTSKDPKDKYRLPILEETLSQLQGKM